MNSNQSSLKVINLDFDDIKDSFSTFLASQDKFKDYNFTGSGLNILMDILAYNTHYNGFYSNMVANEMFLDTAIVRDSIVSHAKQLGYTPRSVTSARVNLKIVATNNNHNGFLDANTPFIATLDGSSYIFRNQNSEKYIPTKFDDDGNTIEWTIDNVELVEGKFKTNSFVVDKNNINQRFIIDSDKIDTSTMKVRVQKSIEDISGYDIPWERGLDSNLLEPTSKVYFLQESSDGKYEVFFGDNIAGQGVENGNVIIVEYMESSGEGANGIGFGEQENTPTFTMPYNYICSVVDYSQGGADRESNESIRYYAPRSYQAQERAVTIGDYEFLIGRDYPFADSVRVWGGEDNEPPVYGKVFIAIKPKNGTVLSDLEKISISNTIIKKRNLVGIQPEIVDPDYVYILFNGVVHYIQGQTNKTATDIQKLIEDGMSTYANASLEKFDNHFRYSNFAAYLDGLDSSIMGTSTDIRIQKRFEPTFDVAISYSINFYNAIWHPIGEGCGSVLTSNGFYIFDPEKATEQDPYSIAYIDDDGSGNVRIYTIEDNKKRYITNTAGTIDYCNGVVELKSFNPHQLVDDVVLRITVVPAERNGEMSVRRDMILLVDDNDTDARIVSVKKISDINAEIETRFCVDVNSSSVGTSTSNLWSETSTNIVS
jgi:hypothetical protein